MSMNEDHHPSELHDPSSKEQGIYTWHHPIWQKLTTRYPELGHAMLFYGKQGCGKQQFSLQFAKWLLCLNKSELTTTLQTACGQCKSCHWFDADTHPQLKQISADFDEKKQSYSAIKIDQIRELNDFIQQTVDGWRVVLIHQADKMNVASSNALLKTLEEPGDRVLMILVSDAMLQLSATIRSRVQQYALDRIGISQAQLYLSQNALTTSENHNEFTADEKQIALALAHHMPLKAQDILNSPWFAKRQSFAQAWTNLVKYKQQPIKFANDWLKELDFKALMMMLRFNLQDMTAYKLQQAIKQSDLDIADLQQYYSLQQLFDLDKTFNQVPIQLGQNVQSALIFEQLCMQLMNVEGVSV
ncbi:DNA polymerase III subunit delta' [Acinetobacter sp.]|uniref:DNA polymerase III subunit delta' n=1 Tax=Acinetobacter sp. TaxID=472 RepID=UPI0035B422A4